MPDDAWPPAGDEKTPPREASTLWRDPSAHTGSGRAQVRFTPGSILADRYRIVAMLGRGGMGEVYRAEDTKLGQQVALKFLPSELARDPRRLQRLYDEVRLGRQVSHPNVCRLYDIADWEGNHFLSMEYIDGEDLASLLRRIGKLPEAKALEIARDLCAGIAAAHSLGIIHRDLKPANVMIDGRGDARITDFGLAALAADLETRREIAGTPAYMAPEQLEGAEVTQKSDLYSLGLIFYAMFTGRSLFEGASHGDALSRRTAASRDIARETGGLDPAVQRVIARCLEEDPAKRPASIHPIVAALPGGDPLQAALDAGETPSPEMIAAAGSTGELRPSIAWPLLVLALLVLLSVAALSPRVRAYGQVELPLEAVELKVRARALLAGVGLTAKPADVAYEMGVDPEYRAWTRERRRAGPKPAEEVEQHFQPVIFGYRESPDVMRVGGRDRTSGFGSIPALEVAGMGQVVLEADGRLRRLVVVPPDQRAANAVKPGWESLFHAAGLNAGEARATTPLWRPPVGSDARFAWVVPVTGPATPVRVEAASFSGQRVWFEVITPWKRPSARSGAPAESRDFAGVLFMSAALASIIVSLLLAHRNLRRGRGDRVSAFRLALAVFATSFVSAMLFDDHYSAARQETLVIFALLAYNCLAAIVIWIWYLALEPYLRRRWPHTLIGWSRLVQGRWLDPLVGRSILIGVLAGGVARFVEWILLTLPSSLGWPPPGPWDTSLFEITGWRYALSFVSNGVRDGIMFGPAMMMLLLILHLVLRRRAFALAAMFVLLMLMTRIDNYPSLEWSGKAIVAAVLLRVMIRHGLLAVTAFEITRLLIGSLPLTLDPSAWYFDRSLLGLAILIGLAVFGFYRSLGAHALFAEPVLEE